MQVSQRPPGDVERERRRACSRGAAPPRCAAKQARIGVERAEVRGGVGARRGADRRLVDEDHLGDALGALDRAARARGADRLAAALLQAAVEDLLDQRRLARAETPVTTTKQRERDVDVDVAEVVRAWRRGCGARGSGSGAPPLRGQRDAPAGRSGSRR